MHISIEASPCMAWRSIFLGDLPEHTMGEVSWTELYHHVSTCSACGELPERIARNLGNLDVTLAFHFEHREEYAEKMREAVTRVIEGVRRSLGTREISFPRVSKLVDAYHKKQIRERN